MAREMSAEFIGRHEDVQILQKIASGLFVQLPSAHAVTRYLDLVQVVKEVHEMKKMHAHFEATVAQMNADLQKSGWTMSNCKKQEEALQKTEKNIQNAMADMQNILDQIYETPSSIDTHTFELKRLATRLQGLRKTRSELEMDKKMTIDWTTKYSAERNEITNKQEDLKQRIEAKSAERDCYLAEFLSELEKEHVK